MSSEFLVHPPPIGRHNPRANFCCRFPADAANAFAMFNGWLHPNRDRGRLARRPTGDALRSPSARKRGEGSRNLLFVSRRNIASCFNRVPSPRLRGFAQK